MRSLSRGLTVLLWISGLVSTIGCRSSRPLVVDAEEKKVEPIRLGILPFTDRVELEKYFSPITQHWSQELGTPVILVSCPDYGSLSEILLQGRIDLAWFSGASYHEAREKRSIIPLMRVIRSGKDTYRGVIVVRADSPVKAVTDLKGRKFAYIDRISGSGFLAPNQIFTAAGISPLEDFSEISFTFSHQDSLDGIREGRFDGAAVFEGALESLAPDPGTFRVLVTSEPLENDVIACHERLRDSLGSRLRKVCLDGGESPRGREILASIRKATGIDGFRPIDPP